MPGLKHVPVTNRTPALGGVAQVALLALAILSLLQSCAAAESQRTSRVRDSVVSLYDTIGTEPKPLVKDWGFAALVRYDGRTILFDTGWDPDTLAHNVRALGASLDGLDAVVISHRHNDHIAGFPFVAGRTSRPPVYLPDDATFWTAPLVAKDTMAKDLPDAPVEFLPLGGREHEHVRQPANAFHGCDGRRVERSGEIMPGVWVIHTESPLVGDFDGYPPHTAGAPRLQGMPELSLAMATKAGLLVVTGCSHSGVDAIVAEAKRVTGQEVDLVFGGFHMQPYDAEQIRAAVAALAALGVKRVAPVHCTGPIGMKLFQQAFGERFVYGGLGIEIELP